MFTIVINSIIIFVFIMKEIKFYNNYKVQSLYGRYIINESIEPVITKYSFNIAGYSVNNLPVYSLMYGNGDIKILLWSQMHGNESTSTKALFDLLSFLENYGKELKSKISLKIIPILNPDGAKNYTRENFNNIDLNRDAQNLTQPESKILRNIYDDFKPDFCFNLHDQRTMYSLDNFNSSVISFSSPSVDKIKSETNSRILSMQIISSIYEKMNNIIPGNVGRYSDEFNINCVGDTFQNLETPTILFESGHYKNDYQREISRKFVCLGLIYALKAILNSKIDYKKYYQIPENKKQLCDIKIINIKVKKDSGYKKTNMSIMFNEKLNLLEKKIEFIPVIFEVGKIHEIKGHLTINFSKIDKIFNLNASSSISQITDYIDKLRNIH